MEYQIPIPKHIVCLRERRNCSREREEGIKLRNIIGRLINFYTLESQQWRKAQGICNFGVIKKWK